MLAIRRKNSGRGSGQGLRMGTSFVLLQLRRRQLPLPPSSKQRLLRSPHTQPTFCHFTQNLLPARLPHCRPGADDLCLHPTHHWPLLHGPHQGHWPFLPFHTPEGHSEALGLWHTRLPGPTAPEPSMAGSPDSSPNIPTQQARSRGFPPAPRPPASGTPATWPHCAHAHTVEHALTLSCSPEGQAHNHSPVHPCTQHRASTHHRGGWSQRLTGRDAEADAGEQGFTATPCLPSQRSHPKANSWERHLSAQLTRVECPGARLYPGSHRNSSYPLSARGKLSDEVTGTESAGLLRAQS